MPADPARESNPYESPRAARARYQSSKPDEPDAAAIRRQRQGLETSFKQNALALVGFLGLLAGMGFWMLGDLPKSDVTFVHFAVVVLISAATVLGLIANWGVRRFAPWARMPLTLVALLGLLFFPLGTVFASSLLNTLYAGEKPRLLSSEYEQIVKATPEMNPRTSAMTWLGLVLLLLLAITVFVLAQIPPEYRHAR